MTDPHPAQIAQHPASVAWTELTGGDCRPTELSTLKEEGRKSAVYRLRFGARGCPPVVAKRCRKEVAQNEATVYEEVLSRVPYPTGRYIGTLIDTHAGVGWLFTEDAGDTIPTLAGASERALAGRWMGTLHRAAAPLVAEVSLPARGGEDHRSNVKSAIQATRAGLAYDAAPAEMVASLTSLASSLARLEMRWADALEELDRIPTTLVHGGFYKKNVRIREIDGTPFLAVFDWESAGWGPPVLDLTSVDLAAYRVTLGRTWPELDEVILTRVSELGKALAVAKALTGEARSVVTRPSSRTIGKFGYYASSLHSSLSRLRW